jgi:hypothetical protein
VDACTQTEPAGIASKNFSATACTASPFVTIVMTTDASPTADAGSRATVTPGPAKWLVWSA